MNVNVSASIDQCMEVVLISYLLHKVWISLTAFLHYVGQQAASERSVDRLGRFAHFPVTGPIANCSRDVHLPTVAIFTPVLFRDDLASPIPVSVVGRRNFLRYFIG